MRNLSCDAGLAEKSFLIGFQILKLRLQCLHYDRAAQILIDAGLQNRFAALSQRRKVAIAHEAVLDVFREIPVCVGQFNILGHESIPWIAPVAIDSVV